MSCEKIEKKFQILKAYPACLASSLDISEKISATTGLVFCFRKPGKDKKRKLMKSLKSTHTFS